MMSTDRGAFCAAGVPIFQLLPEEALRELGKSMNHRRLSKGEVLMTAGTEIRHLIIVAGGRLKVVHTTSRGRQQVVRSLEPGDFLGELALFSGAEYEGDVVAVENSKVCLIAHGVVREVMTRHPAVMVRMLRSLASRLERAEQLIADLGLREVEQRLAAELLRIASTSPIRNGAKVRIPVPWSELAAQLGTTPESLSRRLKELTDRGLVQQLDARTVLIPDVDRLQMLIER